MPNMRITRIGESSPGVYRHATQKVFLHEDQRRCSPFLPEQVVELTDDDWKFFEERLPYEVQLTTDPPTRKVFDREAYGEEPFSFTGLVTERRGQPKFTAEQQAEIDRRIAEHEQQFRADNPNWVDPASIPVSGPPSLENKITDAEMQAVLAKEKANVT